MPTTYKLHNMKRIPFYVETQSMLEDAYTLTKTSSVCQAYAAIQELPLTFSYFFNHVPILLIESQGVAILLYDIYK